MKVECPHCKKILSVPDDYKNKRIKCKYCEQVLKAIPLDAKIVVPTNIVHAPETSEKSSEHKLRPASRVNFITKIWIKSPVPFRNAFLATLGVVSALILSIYIYGNILYSKPKNIDWAEKKLASSQLFRINTDGQIGIFRGRTLTEYKFSPDATQFNPYLSVWADNKNNIVGISTIWNEYIKGVKRPDHSSADDLHEWFINHSIRDGFELLTGCNLTASLYVAQHDGKFYTAKNDLAEESYSESYRKWHIMIARWKINNENQVCIGYTYSATAQNW